MIPLLKYWAPAIAWTLLMFFGSSDLMSAEHTSRFLGPFLRWMVPDISAAAITSIQLLVRKAAHLSEYAVLAIFVARVVRFHVPTATLRTQMMLALGLTIAFAMADEFHQSFVPSRTASPYDVGLDCLGAVAGLIISWVVIGRAKSKI